MRYNKRMRLWYWIAPLLLTMVCVALLTHCVPSTPYVEWEYIIPENYTGYLAIRFDCPGGTPLVIQNNIVRIEFRPDGTYCTSDTYFPSSTRGDRAWNTSGTSIPILDPPWDQKGYAVCCGGTQVIGGGTLKNPGEDIVVILLWVGDMERVDASWPAMPDSENAFFAERFGLRYPDDDPNVTPTDTSP